MNIIVFIKTAQGRIKSVSQKLLELNELVYLAFSSGSFDIQIEVLLKNTAEALHFFTNTLSKIPGIVEIDTYINLRVERIPYDWKLPDVNKLSMM